MTTKQIKKAGEGLSYEEKGKRGLLTAVDIMGKASNKKGERKMSKNGKGSNGITISQMKAKARMSKIKGWYAMNVDELSTVLKADTAKTKVAEIGNAAAKRYAEYNQKYLKAKPVATKK